MDKSTMYFLLARFMDTEYEASWLATVSKERFDAIKKEMVNRFDGIIELNDTDIKEAWKEWINYAAYNGTLVSPFLSIEDPEANYKHHELQVIDLVIKLANETIDSLQ